MSSSPGSELDEILFDSPSEIELLEDGSVKMDTAQGILSFRQKGKSYVVELEAGDHKLTRNISVRQPPWTDHEKWEKLPDTWDINSETWNEFRIGCKRATIEHTTSTPTGRGSSSPAEYPEQDGDLFGLNPMTMTIPGSNPPKASPTLISQTIVANGLFAMEFGDKESIWWCDRGVWRKNGIKEITKAVDRVGGDLSSERLLREVIRRVKNGVPSIEFDTENPYLLGCKNGVIDLKTSEFRSYRPGDRIIEGMVIPVEYDPDAKCPAIINMLMTSVPNLDQFLTVLDIIASGAILEPIPIMAMFLGLGSNGKGLVEKLIRSFYGRDSIRSISLGELTANRFALSSLRKARFCISSEESYGQKATERLKSILGGDEQDADVKFEGRRKFIPFTKLIADANRPPIFTDTSFGFQRRFCKVDFPFTFKDNPDSSNPLERKRDPDLLEKITSPEELSGLLNIVVQRAKIIADKKEIHRGKDDLHDYEGQSKSGYEFIKRFLEWDPEEIRSDWRVTSDHVMERFDEWRQYAVAGSIPKTTMSNLIRNESGISTRSIRVGEKVCRGYVGIRIKEAELDAWIRRKKDELGITDLATLTSSAGAGDLSSSLPADIVTSSNTNVTPKNVSSNTCNTCNTGLLDPIEKIISQYGDDKSILNFYLYKGGNEKSQKSVTSVTDSDSSVTKALQEEEGVTDPVGFELKSTENSSDRGGGGG